MLPNAEAEHAKVREHIAAYANDDPDIELELWNILGVAA